MIEKNCPFNAGEEVTYWPSPRGLGLEAMPSHKLVPGNRYKVHEIQKEKYVVVEGYDHPGGGLYWTEFEPAK